MTQREPYDFRHLRMLLEQGIYEFAANGVFLAMTG